jgi:hypothetical protein
MATTTPNFGWPVPTSTDLVKDGATAIEGLGDAIDASLLDLKGGTSGQVLKKNSNTDMDFIWSADSAGMTNPMTTTGDTIYSSSGSTPARLGIGSTGQVLTVAGGVPSWATPAAGGGGKVLQVVYGSTTTPTSVNTTTYTDTSLSASITPSATTSKVLVITNLEFYMDINTTNKKMSTRLVRGSTTVFTDDTGSSSGITALGSSAVGQYNRTAIVYLDSPSTTSSTTYKVQGAGNTASGSLNFQEGNAPSSIILMEIGA